MASHTRRSKALWLLLGLPAALLLAALASDLIWGGGHPSLSAVLLFWASYPTLAGYLSRELLGTDFLNPPDVAWLSEGPRRGRRRMDQMGAVEHTVPVNQREEGAVRHVVAATWEKPRRTHADYTDS
jgi:hypothetical protein